MDIYIPLLVHLCYDCHGRHQNQTTLVTSETGVLAIIPGMPKDFLELLYIITGF
jgi:hypothetical protein